MSQWPGSEVVSEWPGKADEAKWPGQPDDQAWPGAPDESLTFKLSEVPEGASPLLMGYRGGYSPQQQDQQPPRSAIGEGVAAAEHGIGQLAQMTGLAGPVQDPFQPSYAGDDAGFVRNALQYAGRLAGGLVAPALAATVGGPPAAGVVLGAQGFATSRERGASIPAAAASGLIQGVAGAVPFGGALSKGLVKGGLIAGASNIAADTGSELATRAGGGKAEDLSFSRAFEQFAIGTGVHGTVSGLKGLSTAARTKLDSISLNKFEKQLLSEKVVTPEEIKLAAGRRKVLEELATQRYAGYEVKVRAKLDDQGRPVLEPDGKPKLIAQIRKDVVPWETQKALGHNPALIEAERQAVLQGKPPLVVSEPTGPLLADEISSVKSRFDRLYKEVKSSLTLDDVTPDGLPATRKGLLLVDLNRVKQRLSELDTPQGRVLYDQINGLLKYGARTKNLTDPIALDEAQAAATNDGRIISPIDVRPQVELRFPLKMIKDAGYLKPATELSPNPKTQERIGKLQAKTIEELQAIRSTDKLSVPEKLRAFKLLDSKYSEKLDLLLSKDNNNARGAKRRVRKAIAEAKIPEAEQVSALNALDTAIDEVSKKFIGDTQIGTIERLITEAQKPAYGVSKNVISLLEHLHTRMVTDESYLPWGERVRRSYDALRATTKVFAGLDRTGAQAKVLEAVKSLPSEWSEPLLKAALDAKTKPELAKILEDVKTTQESFLRKTATESVAEAVKGLGKNPAREPIIAELRKLVKKPLAQGTEHNVAATVTYKGQVFEGVDHADARTKAYKAFPKEVKEIQDTGVDGFKTSTGRVVDRTEAAVVGQKAYGVDLSKALEVLQQPKPKAVDPNAKPQRELFYTEPKTGVEKVDVDVLRKTLEKLPLDQVAQLRNRVAQLTRQAQIEKGVVNEALGYDTKTDSKDINKSLRGLADQTPRQQNRDALTHVGKLVVDPKMYESFLLQIARGVQSHPVYRLFHGDLREPMNRHLQNHANTRRVGAQVAKETLGIDTSSIKGLVKLTEYLHEPVTEGVSRDRAMIAYALSKDAGRASDLAQYGVEIKGKVYDAEEMISKLSDRDKAFVDRLKSYFDNNPFVERAFSNFALYHGYEPPRVKGWFTSVRQGLKTKLDSDFGSFTTTLMREIDPLAQRSESADQPFVADKGFYSSFLQVADKLSLFGEMGKELNRAERAFIDPEVKRTLTAKLGKAEYRSLELYLSNIHSKIGHSQTAFDSAINKLITNFTISRVAFSVFSAAKQGLHMLTMYGDGTVDASALTQALRERAAFDKSVDKRMIESSGMAYDRYTGGRYLENLLALGEEDKLPTKTSLYQYRSMVLQRTIDRGVMRTAWRAAELTAKRQGLKGQAALDKTREIFDVVAGRDQPTDNPLYASELEIQAKRSPLARGALVFAREQNRMYNVVRRHVVLATQDPTPQNIARAGRALMFTVVGNAIGIVGINSLRRAAFAKDTEEKDVARDTLGTVTGMFYLMSPVPDLVDGFFNPQAQSSDRLLGPIGTTLYDGMQTAWHLGNAVSAGDEEIRSGANRGESKASRELSIAAEKAASVASGGLGLPFWALWYQGKGLYNWTRPDYLQMTTLEKERARLKADGLEGTARWNEIDEAKKRINSVHQKREKGLLTKDSAQAAIRRELDRVVR